MHYRGDIQMKKQVKKLVLAKETLRTLELVAVQGGTSGLSCYVHSYCGLEPSNWPEGVC